jgi:hypothetical protein
MFRKRSSVELFNSLIGQSFAALPRHHTQARSLDKLIERVREAIELCLEVNEIFAHHRIYRRAECFALTMAPSFDVNVLLHPVFVSSKHSTPGFFCCKNANYERSATASFALSVLEQRQSILV